LILSAVFISSCEMSFDVKLQDEERLFILCTPGTNDTTVIQLWKSISTGCFKYDDPFVDDARIELFINGTPGTIERTIEGTSCVPPCCWYSVDKLSVHDHLVIEVLAGNMRQIHAETTIPEPFPEYRLSANDSLITVSFEDDLLSGDYYGAHLFVETAIRTFDDAGNYKDTLLYNIVLPCIDRCFDIGFNGWTFGDPDSTIRIWSDEDFNGSHCEILFNVSMSNLVRISDYNNAEIRFRYKLSLYKFSEEFHNYAESLNRLNTNVLSALGMATASVSYTNVSHGSGIVAGWSVREYECSFWRFFY